MNSTQSDISELVARLDRSMGAITRSAAIRRFYQRLVEAAGTDLERPAYLVLKHLEAEGATRITDLAQQHGVEPSTMSRHVTSLETAGLLTKRPLPEDRRVALTEITDAGCSVVSRVEAERHRLFTEVLESWDTDDAERYVALIERFNDELAELLERP